MNDDAELAYACDSHYPDEGTEVLFLTRSEAEELLAYYENVRRVPEFDHCTDAESLARAQLNAGWWFECRLCLRKTDCDDDELPPTEPHVWLGFVYCSPWCAGADAVQFVERRVRVWELIDLTLRRFPGAEIQGVSPTAGFKTKTGIVRFKKPEWSGVVEWCPGDREASVPPKYRDEFVEWMRSDES